MAGNFLTLLLGVPPKTYVHKGRRKGFLICLLSLALGTNVVRLLNQLCHIACHGRAGFRAEVNVSKGEHERNEIVFHCVQLMFIMGLRGALLF